MKIVQAAAIFIAGLLLGSVTLRPRPVSAQGNAHVTITPVGMLDAKNLASQTLPGSHVAGISCIPKPATRLPDAAVCYVATTP